ncbi:hypothetical protein BDB01DRAFT_801076 [Pilobolus umbonatus]|nr:hypothetical protein BDB01DRAFT_801076 [Pilobolus umbonatus]
MSAISTLTKAIPAVSNISKRAVRTYFSTPATAFSHEEPKQSNHEDKAHHQVAPLTNSTIYAPQGVNDENSVIFTPVVNAVFDE